jgi:tRNA (guanine37-N1)-methyltransferase
MELLAGEDNLMADLRESNCRFKFDFSKVYWNSRLQAEHDRIVKTYFKPGQFVCDVFAGIGPFAIPAAKNIGCTVFANDLNPESFKFLSENVLVNKVSDKVAPFNMDGREFIKNSIAKLNDGQIHESLASFKKKNPKQAEKPIDMSFKVFHHYVMNLPATAIEFLGIFITN